MIILALVERVVFDMCDDHRDLRDRGYAGVPPWGETGSAPAAFRGPTRRRWRLWYDAREEGLPHLDGLAPICYFATPPTMTEH